MPGLSATIVVNAPLGVLFDRDGTFGVDGPYNGDRAAVVPMRDARAALDLVRKRGLPTGVVSSQSGIGRRLLRCEQVDSVNARVEELVGHFDVWRPDAGAASRLLAWCWLR